MQTSAPMSYSYPKNKKTKWEKRKKKKKSIADLFLKRAMSLSPSAMRVGGYGSEVTAHASLLGSGTPLRGGGTAEGATAKGGGGAGSYSSGLFGGGGGGGALSAAKALPLTSSSTAARPFQMESVGADPSIRRSNLVIRGVVCSVKRELASTNKHKGGGGGRGEGFSGANNNSNNSYASGANPHIEGVGEIEHVATFVLDASEEAASRLLKDAGGPNSPSRRLGGGVSLLSGSGSPSPSSSLAGPLPLSVVKAGGLSNTVTLRLAGDWALSTSFVVVGDIIEIARFEVDSTDARSSSSPFSSSRNSSEGGGASTGLVIVTNNSTELHVTRMKNIKINQENVGQLELLELTEREQADARHAFSDIRPRLFGDRNTFSQVDAYYDVIKGQSETINPHMAFLQSLFGSRTRLLDAGCGSGLYSFAFRGYGVYPVCLDASHAMQRRFEMKNRFFRDSEASSSINPEARRRQQSGGFGLGQAGFHAGEAEHLQSNSSNRSGGGAIVSYSGGVEEASDSVASGNSNSRQLGPNTTRHNLIKGRRQSLATEGSAASPPSSPFGTSGGPVGGGGGDLEFHLADIASFSLARRDADGNVQYTAFEGVLCLDVLALLPDVDSIRAAVHNLSLHTCKGGIAVISFPNTSLVLEKGCHMNTTAYEMDRFQLSVGAVSVPQGTLHLTETVLIEVPTPSPTAFPTSGSSPLSHASSLSRGNKPGTGYYGNGGSRLGSTLLNNNSNNNKESGLVASSALPRRITTWRGTAFHPSAAGAGEKFVTFVEMFSELLLSAGLIEEIFGECGYAIRALYGTLCGEPFVESTSENRYYVLQRY